MARGTRLLADVRPLRESAAFRRLWLGTTLSSMGSALTGFCVILQVFDITRSPVAVGALGIAEMVPTLAIGLLGGAVADAMDRRRLLLITGSGGAAVSAAFAAQALAGLHVVWLLYALTAVESSLRAAGGPALGAVVPGLLSPGLLPAGLMLSRLSFYVTLTASPALAGVIVATPHLGLRACYLIDAASFAASLYGVGRLPAMRPRASAAQPGLRAVAEGISFIRRSQVLAGAFLADLNATVFGLPAALFPAINAERFGGSPRTLGLFATAVGLGGLVSAAFSGPVTRTWRQGRAMLCTVAIWGAAFAGFAIAPGLWLTLGLLAVAGAADVFTIVFRGAILQAATPDHLRGRVMGADYVVAAGGSQVGNLEAGALGSLTSPVISALSGGLATIAGAILIGLTMPAFTRYRRQPHDLIQQGAPAASAKTPAPAIQSSLHQSTP